MLTASLKTMKMKTAYPYQDHENYQVQLSDIKKSDHLYAINTEERVSTGSSVCHYKVNHEVME